MDFKSSDSAASKFLPAAALGGAVVLWGCSFAAAKSSLEGLSPMALMWLRMALAGLAIAPFLGRIRPRNFRPADIKLLAPMTLLMPCGYFLLEANALTLTSSSQAGVISSSVPLLVAMGAGFFLGERITARTVLGLIISVLGVAWLSLGGESSARAVDPLTGNLMEFGAMCCAAGYMLLVKKLSSRYGPWFLTAVQTFVGVIFFLPGAGEGIGALFGTLSLGDILAVVYLGVGVTLGAFGLYNWAVSRVPAAGAAASVNLVPVVSLVMGWGLMGEGLTPAQGLASAMVLAGVLVSQASTFGWKGLRPSRRGAVLATVKESER